MKKLLIIFFLLSVTTTYAVTITPLPEPTDWFSRTLIKIYFCRYDLKCYFLSPKLGVSTTTIWATTTIASFPTIHNNNINALNDGKIENSSTSIAAIRSLPNLASTAATGTATIIAGTWQGNTLQSLYGGTGTTTLSQFRVVLGNGTSSTTVATSTGSNGQVLTSAGEGVGPSWVTLPPTNVGSNYAWTGQHSWSQPMNASSSLLVANNLAISTSSPSTKFNLTVTGGALIAGTTTVSNLIVASTTPFRIGTQYFTATSTWTIPRGVTQVEVEVYGAGGGGGGTGSGGCAGGGGAGGYAFAKIATTTNLAINVATKGIGGSAGVDGSTPVQTDVGGLVIANGGAGGTSQNAACSASAGGGGGTASGGDLNTTGQAGMTSVAGTEKFSGSGGNSPKGFGGRSKIASATNGEAASGFGAGGSGAGTGNGSGGNGSDGLVIIRWVEQIQ